MSEKTEKILQDTLDQVLIDIHKSKVKDMMTESDYEGVEAKRHFGSTRLEPEEDRGDSEIQRVLTNLEKEVEILSEVISHLSAKLDPILLDTSPNKTPDDEASISPESQIGMVFQEKANQIESLRIRLQDLYNRVAL